MCILHSGVWWYAIRGFSHRRFVLADMNALRNPPLIAPLSLTPLSFFPALSGKF